MWSAVVLAVLSSRMSVGGCSLAGRRDNVPCFAITAIPVSGGHRQRVTVCGGLQVLAQRHPFGVWSSFWGRDK